MSTAQMNLRMWGPRRGPRTDPQELYNLILRMMRKECWATWDWFAGYFELPVETVRGWWKRLSDAWGLERIRVGAKRWVFRFRRSNQPATTPKINHPPNREELVSGSEEESTKQVLYTHQDYTDARKDATRTPTTTEQQGKPSTESVTNVPLIYPDNFRSFVGICVASGRGLSNPDIAAAFSTWQAKRIEELGLSEKVLNRYMAACRDASMPRYVPTPAMWLQMEGWTREELPRLLPPKGKVERAIEGAREILKRRGLL